MSEELRVLQVEDSESDASLMQRRLASAGYDVHVERVEDADGMRAALATKGWDVIISDHQLPRFDAWAALGILQETGRDTPFIVVSGAIGEETAVALMKAGAHDYLLKESLGRLAPVVRREIREARMRREGKQAEKVLREKEALLGEIHHRVKNNMQVVSSLLALQARAVSNDETKRMLEDTRNRIHSMAMLHETLYESGELAAVDFPKYILQMTNYLFRSYGVESERIRVHTDVEDVNLNLDAALPCGLLVNEVITNALKHAFPEGRGGEVRIVLRERLPGAAGLELSDDGVGLPEGLDWATSRSLGLRLIRELARQLSATLDIESARGTRVRLTFPIASANPI
jgi:two-component sensor histidine kinase